MPDTGWLSNPNLTGGHGGNGGVKEWYETEAVRQQGGASAYIGSTDMAAGQFTNWLHTRGYNPSLPVGCIVTGVSARVYIRKSRGSATLTSMLLQRTLPFNTFLTETDRNPNRALSSSFEWLEYGGRYDKWGYSALSRAICLEPDFGLAMDCQANASGTNIQVDALQIKIWYNTSVQAVPLPADEEERAYSGAAIRSSYTAAPGPADEEERSYSGAAIRSSYTVSFSQQAHPNVESVTETAFAVAATAHAVAMPETRPAGDLSLVLFSNDTGATVATPDGWIQLFTLERGTSARGSAFARIFADGDPATVDFVTSAAVTAAAQVYRISGWQGTIAGGVQAQTPVSTTGSAPDPAAFTAAIGASNNLFIAFCSDSATLGLTSAPANYTDLVSTLSALGTTAAQMYSARITSSSDTEDTGAWTFQGSGARIISTIVVGPAPAPLLAIEEEEDTVGGTAFNSSHFTFPIATPADEEEDGTIGVPYRSSVTLAQPAAADEEEYAAGPGPLFRSSVILSPTEAREEDDTAGGPAHVALFFYPAPADEEEDVVASGFQIVWSEVQMHPDFFRNTQQSRIAAFPTLVEITHPDMPDVMRFTDAGIQIASGGFIYEAMDMTISLPSNGRNQAAEGSITLPIQSRKIAGTFREYVGPFRFTFRIVDGEDHDVVYETWVLWHAGVETSGGNALIALNDGSFNKRVFPPDKFDARWRGVYK